MKQKPQSLEVWFAGDNYKPLQGYTVQMSAAGMVIIPWRCLIVIINFFQAVYK